MGELPAGLGALRENIPELTSLPTPALELLLQMGNALTWEGFGVFFPFPRQEFSMVPFPEPLWCLKPELTPTKH